MSATIPAGFTANVVQTAANKGVLLALVAMAQTLVVLTAGIDLSVGMIFILTNCVASYLVTGSAVTARSAIVGVLIAGFACGVAQRVDRHLWTAATDRHDHRDRLDLLRSSRLWLRPQPGSSDDFYKVIADAMTSQLPGGIPVSLVALLVIVLVVWVPFRRSAGRPRGLCRRDRPRWRPTCPACRSGGRSSPPTRLSGLLSAMGGLYVTFITCSGEASFAERQHLYAPFDRRRRARRRLAVRRRRQRGRRHLRRACLPHHRRPAASSSISSRCGRHCSRASFCSSRSASGPARLFQVRNRLDLFA